MFFPINIDSSYILQPFKSNNKERGIWLNPFCILLVMLVLEHFFCFNDFKNLIVMADCKYQVSLFNLFHF